MVCRIAAQLLHYLGGYLIAQTSAQPLDKRHFLLPDLVEIAVDVLFKLGLNDGIFHDVALGPTKVKFSSCLVWLLLARIELLLSLEALSYHPLLVLGRLVLLGSRKSLSYVDVAKSTSRIEAVPLHLVDRYSRVVLDIILLVLGVGNPLVVVICSVVGRVVHVLAQVPVAPLVGDALVIRRGILWLLMLIRRHHLWVLLAAGDARHPLFKMLLLNDSAVVGALDASLPIQAELEVVVVLDHVRRQVVVLAL